MAHDAEQARHYEVEEELNVRGRKLRIGRFPCRVIASKEIFQYAIHEIALATVRERCLYEHAVMVHKCHELGRERSDVRRLAVQQVLVVFE